MKKFLKNKINIVLLFFLILAGATLMIVSVDATDSYIVENEAEEDSQRLVLKSKFEISDVDEAIKSPDLKYILRGTEEENPLGFIDSTMVRCFSYMKPVSFSPRYKFLSQNSNGTAHRFYGFSIPLVGDLNGDGKPEIVGLGIRDNGAGGPSQTIRYIYILNGQTGKEIVRFTLPMEFYVGGLGYHGSPCQLALIDSDRNGKGEIILAFGYGANSEWNKRVVSWEVNDKTFDSNYSSTDNSKLTLKWKSSDRYDRYGSNGYINSAVFGKPIPQVVDINSDGVPEVIVYNKIYNAVTGELIMKIEELASTANAASFFFGGDRSMYFSDNLIGFPFIYDIDFDGKYDIIAGGKVYYNIDLNAKTFETVDYSSVIGDAHTGVADINADGLPEIVTLQYINRASGQMRLSVWSPNLVKKDEHGKIVPGTGTPELLAERDIQQSYEDTGNHSYLFIGDIDGREQNGKKMPEITILSSRMFVPSYGSYTSSTIPVHPNVSGLLAGSFNISSGVSGHIMGLTWDDNDVTYQNKLKVSFVMEHQDNSSNTGFTLFDFDNDGIQDICYRDEQTLRIISASIPFVTLGESRPSVIRFKQNVGSYTGFEYPVIADVDGDASADMIVMGHNVGGGQSFGYVYAVEGANGDLAPAPKVWNQFFYSPLKINEDLTTPKKIFHPLDDKYFYKERETDTEKTYIYNKTINQTPIYTISESGVVQPIVRTPDAKLLDLAIDMLHNQITFKVTNIGDATVNAETVISIYANNTLFKGETVGHGGIFPGDTISYVVDITNNVAIYTVVVGAKLDTNMNMIPEGSYVDCNWADNMDDVASFLPKDDATTVVQYGTTMIDVLANDILSSECTTQILSSERITTPGGQGVMSGDFGSLQIVNNKLLYTAPQSYASNNNVVELTYTLTCSGVDREATVYIYILESCDFGFASCAGSPFNVCVKKIPSDISFEWYDNADQYIGDTSPYIPNLTTDMIYYAKPSFSETTGTAEKYKTVEFPKGKIIIKALSSSDHLKAKWTGVVDTDWYNPANWVQVLTNGSETPVTWAPVGCVDVTIPNGTENYPELNQSTNCGTIHMGDRAMIAGIHLLTYTEASVDFNPVGSEKNRFVMWSAPLKDMYTGDYHFANNAGQPDWGHVYMNFFQSANPDYSNSVETEKNFTATFGSTGTPLPLGTAFNIKIMGGKEEGFSFPKAATSYTSADGSSSGMLNRTNSKRFITDGAINTSGVLSLPVKGNNAFGMIQVVNPFMAYLDVFAFLGANSSSISGSYRIWNGDVNEDFITVLAYDDNQEMRYIIDGEVPTGSARYIAPLQSFFVTKLNASTAVTALTMNATTMTTTKNGITGSYVLRSAARGETEDGLLRVTATSGNAENSTVLLRRPGAQQEFSTSEDAEKFFNHGAPVSVYTLANMKKAVAINVSETFKGDVKLGVRVRDTESPVTLSFSGLSRFGQGVTLIDHAQGDKEIDIRKNPYVFTVDPEGNKDVVELNNRFSLRFSDNPTGIDEVEDDNIQVKANDGKIIVSSASVFDRVEVFNLSGMKIHDNSITTSYAQLSVIDNQVYIVKLTIGDRQIVKKIFVK